MNDTLQGIFAVLFLAASDSEKLEMLARWFDMHDKLAGKDNDEVQVFLRDLAERIAYRGDKI